MLYRIPLGTRKVPRLRRSSAVLQRLTFNPPATPLASGHRRTRNRADNRLQNLSPDHKPLANSAHRTRWRVNPTHVGHTVLNPCSTLHARSVPGPGRDGPGHPGPEVPPQGRAGGLPCTGALGMGRDSTTPSPHPPNGQQRRPLATHMACHEATNRLPLVPDHLPRFCALPQPTLAAPPSRVSGLSADAFGDVAFPGIFHQPVPSTLHHLFPGFRPPVPYLPSRH